MTTAIQWTDETWNPSTGCDRVSPGCDNCYALTMAGRLKAMGQRKYWRDGDPRTSGPGFGVVMHLDALDLPFKWRKPRRVFVNSMSDLFHESVSDNFIGSVFNTMALTPQHTYQILTKRHARMRSLLTKWQDAGWTWRRDDMMWCGPLSGPLPNVWLGVSAEDQHWADIRIPALLRTPAAVRFVSAEPLLGPITFRWAKWHEWRDSDHLDGLRQLDWVIVGGESGPGARPMDIGWARSLVEECREAGVTPFVKQLGAVRGRELGIDAHGADWDGWPEDLRVRAFPATLQEVVA